MDACLQSGAAETCFHGLRGRSHLLAQRFLQGRSCFLQVVQDSLGRRQCERVTHKRSRKEGHSDLRSRIVAVLPGAAIERVEILRLSRHYADRIAAADNLPIGGQIGANPVVLLRSALGNAETCHHLVEDQRRSRLGRNVAQLAQEGQRLHLRMPALHRLDQNRGDLARVRADNLQRLL